MVVANSGLDLTVGTPMNIGGVELDGVTSASESGAMYAPERTVEQGFAYASFVGPEARTGQFEVTLHPPKLPLVQALRSKKEPFRVLVSHVQIRKCKLTDLTIDHEASIKSHFSASIKVKQVKEVSTGSADLVVDNSDGSGGGSTKTEAGDEPTMYRTEAKTKETSDGGPDPEAEGKKLGARIGEWTGLVDQGESLEKVEQANSGG